MFAKEDLKYALFQNTFFLSLTWITRRKDLEKMCLCVLRSSGYHDTGFHILLYSQIVKISRHKRVFKVVEMFMFAKATATNLPILSQESVLAPALWVILPSNLCILILLVLIIFIFLFLTNWWQKQAFVSVYKSTKLTVLKKSLVQRRS